MQLLTSTIQDNEVHKHFFSATKRKILLYFQLDFLLYKLQSFYLME